MTPGNKQLHHEHIRCLKEKLRDYNMDPLADGPARCLTNGRELDVAMIDGLIQAGNNGERRFNEFVKERLVEGNLSIFDTITKVKLDIGKDSMKLVSKTISILKEDRQAFGLLITKSVDIKDAFINYPITSLPLSIATPNSGLFQAGKAGFRNHIINEANAVEKNSPTEAQWIVDGMAAFRSIKPKDTYEDWFVQLIKFLTPPANANGHSLDIIMDNYIESSVKEGTRQNRAGDPGSMTYITSSENATRAEMAATAKQWR